MNDEFLSENESLSVKSDKTDDESYHESSDTEELTEIYLPKNTKLKIFLYLTLINNML